MAKKTNKPDANPPPKPDPGGTGSKRVTEGDGDTKPGAAKKKPPGKPEAPQQTTVTTTDLSKALLTKEVVWWNPAKLKFPFASAVRKHTKEEEDQLRASINEHGILQPLLITEDGKVIEGHGRARISLDRKIPKVPCIVVEGISDDEAWQIALR